MPSTREVEHKQSSTSALIPEEEIVGSSMQEDEIPLMDHTDTDIMDDIRPRESKSKRLAASSAQREYAQAINVIGSSSARRSAVLTVPTKRSRVQPSALLLEDEIEENWLEDDLPSPTRKSSKKSNLSLPIHKPSYQSDREKKPSFTPSRPNKYQ